ncbi:MAG: PKD domain-containing protein [Ferruginibacter sp.]
MEFVENKGQWHTNAKFRADFATGAVFLEDEGFTVMLHNEQDVQALSAILHGKEETINRQPLPEKFVFHSFAYKVKLLGATANSKQIAGKQLAASNNYFIGGDQANWASDCKIFQAVTYENIYPNIDLRYYSSSGHLKYDFIVRPGGNPNAIALRYDGPELSIKDRELQIKTPVGTVRELYPYTYQSAGGRTAEISCKYILKDNVVTFQVKNYNFKETLVIDPSVIFSTFSGSSAQNWGYTATPGPDGSLYGGGIVFGGGYPVTSGAFDQTYNNGEPEGAYNGYDIGITKFSAGSGSRVFSTYIGGSGNEQPHSLVCDAQGNLYIAGRTSSVNFPLKRGQADITGSRGGSDIFAVKLNTTGSVLLGSMVIGGSENDGINIRAKYVGTRGAESLRRNYGDDARSEIILDPAGNVFVASCTQSSNFPVVGSSIQTRFGGGLQDGVILKFNAALTSVLFSTYFGGNDNDACFVAGVNPSDGNLYIGGATASSTGLPGDKTGVVNPTYQGGIADGFVTILRNDGSAVIKTSYFGTGGIDLVYGLKFDRKGFPYIMGTSTGSWTVLNAAYSNPGAKQFISKLRPDLTGFIYSTVFGTAAAQPNISPIAFLVDRCENVYVSGWGGGINVFQDYSNGTTANLPIKDPLRGVPAPDGKDFYFFVLEKNAGSQLFGSHFGKSGGSESVGEHVDGGTSRFDENGVIYQAICAECQGSGAFPVTAGAYSCANTGGYNLAVIKIEMNFAGVGSNVQSSVGGIKNDTTICVGGRVDFTDSLMKGKKYYWDFADNPNRYDTTTVPSSFHVFNTAGNFRVMLISEDSTTCNIRDTSYITIRVGTIRATAGFQWRKLDPCESLTVQFTNTSTSLSNNFNPQTFTWDFGDGSAPLVTDFPGNPVHIYQAPGNYTVILTINDSYFCNSPVSDTQLVRLNSRVQAAFSTAAVGCAPYTASFTNNSLAGTDFKWEYGDGQFSTNASAVHTHLYTQPGTYNVRLIATDLSTCNKIDTSDWFSIRVSPKPRALATWAPNPPQVNTPTNFTNQSTGAIRYLWNFGDGESSTQINPSHQYNETKTFDAELIAYNADGCTDTFALRPQALIEPLLDVPNAFTPGKFGVNAFIDVRGFGIVKMDWKIYNRWGQMIYHSTDRKRGWDGTYKGKLQPMDVYTYTLDAEFSDGVKLRKTGDITLLR